MSLFITFEGMDGVGKSTQVALLKNKFEKDGYQVSVYREPGATDTGENIRDILLQCKGVIADKTELLLFLAARAQLCHEKIIPDLSSGKIVICDRFCDSTFAYQGGGRGMDIDTLSWLNEYATGGLMPDCTFLLMAGTNCAYERISSRGQDVDRFEKLGSSFKSRTMEAYKNLADSYERIHVVNAEGSIQDVHHRIYDILKNKYSLT